jgi:hypothetical protein
LRSFRYRRRINSGAAFSTNSGDDCCDAAEGVPSSAVPTTVGAKSGAAPGAAPTDSRPRECCVSVRTSNNGGLDDICVTV